MYPRNAPLDRVFAAARAVLCVGLTSFLVARSSDRRESFYPSLADADKARAITRGWIPDFLPENARTIREAHEISLSTEWCAFEFLPAAEQYLRHKLKSVDVLPSSVKRVPSPGVSWWPAVLDGNLDVEKIHHEGLDLYVVITPETSVTMSVSLFAIDWSKGNGFFYWTRQ